MDQFEHVRPCSRETNTKVLYALTLSCKAPVQETQWISVRADSGVPIAVLSKHVETSEHYESNIGMDTAVGHKRINCWSDAALCKTWF